MCHTCGAFDTRRLGPCVVCTGPVCEKCGNVQHIKGEHRVVHNSCLDKEDHGFTMIKFVK